MSACCGRPPARAAGVAMSATNTPLYTVTIPAGRFSRIRVGKKEVRLGGQLFDIKNQRVCGDSIALTLYHDRDEEKALHTLSVLLAPDTGAGDASAPPLYQWLSRWLGTFYLPPVVPEIHPPATLAFHSVFRCLVPVAQAGPGCFSPPPEG